MLISWMLSWDISALPGQLSIGALKLYVHLLCGPDTDTDKNADADRCTVCMCPLYTATGPVILSFLSISAPSGRFKKV